MSEIRLRLRSSTGTALISLPSHLPFKSLQDEIQSKTSIPVPYQDLRKGYPPTSFTYSSSTPLSSTDLSSGETITIEKRSTPVPLSNFESSLKLIRRIIPADNSCLFNAVAYTMEGRNKNLGSFLRNVVSSIVQDDPETYNVVLLGKSNEEYCEWIERNTSWGGAIELSILSKYYGVSIGAVSVRDEIIHMFGEEFGYDKVVYVVYDGIHYDVLAKNLGEEEKEETDLTVFEKGDRETWEMALEVAREMKRNRQFTDTAGFTLRCGVCGVGMVGEKEAIEHATATQHQNFMEYKS